jgi:hypothetical protein
MTTVLLVQWASVTPCISRVSLVPRYCSKMCDVVLVVACSHAGKSDLLRQHDMRRFEGLMMTAMLPTAN